MFVAVQRRTLKPKQIRATYRTPLMSWCFTTISPITITCPQYVHDCLLPASLSRPSTIRTRSVAVSNRTVDDSRLRPRVRNLAAPPGESPWIISYVTDSKPGVFDPLCENMRSSTKLEVHNLLHCCQKRTEPPPEVTCTEIFVKFEPVAYEMYEPTDRQTYRQTYRHVDRNTSHPSIASEQRQE